MSGTHRTGARFGARFASATLVGALLSGCASQGETPVESAPRMAASEAEATALIASAETPAKTLCEPGESAAFSGHVQDDFGLTISVCIKPETAGEDAVISIRNFGEGGGTVLSCRASECDGIIGMQHYRRYRFSILTLEWEQDGARQKLVESHNAEDASADPQHSLSHSWSSAEDLARGIEPTEYPVAADTEPLSLLALEAVLPSKDWPEPALAPIEPSNPPTGATLEASGAIVPGENEGRWRQLYFGDRKDDVIAQLTPVLGNPEASMFNSECPAGPLEVVSFGAVSLSFMDDAWLGWFANTGSPGMESMLVSDGLEPGDSARLPENAERFSDSSLGEEFAINEINGLIENDAISARWAGLNCIFR